MRIFLLRASAKTIVGSQWQPVVLCAVMFGVFSYLQPYWLDTLLFQNILHRCCPDGLSVQGFVAFVADVASFDNARLFNLMAPLIADYLPKWLDGALVGFMAALLFWAIGRLAGLRRSDGSLWWLLLAIFFIVLPWHNNLLVPDYSLNYIYTSALSLAVVVVALHGSRASAAVAAVLAVVAGWGLEGIGGTLLAGAVGMMLAVGQFRRYGVLYAVSALATAAGAAAFFATHLTERLAYEVTLPWIIENMPTWLLFNCFTVGLVVLVALMALTRKGRRRMAAFVDANPLSVYFFAVAVATMALSGMLARSYRVTFWPQVCAIVVWGMVLLPFLRRHGRAVKVLAVSGAVCVIFIFGNEATLGARCRKISDDAMAQLEQPETLTAYMPLLHPAEYQLMLRRFAPAHMFVYPPHIYFLREYFGRHVAIVPRELRHVDTSIAPDSLCFTAGGIGYFRPSEPKVTYDYKWLPITTRGRRTFTARVYYCDYIAPDGTPMTWVQPIDIVPDSVAAIGDIVY